ncbi:ABC transporter permease [bacterium]|nr:MAG: ABC transporter permease [bacterium]
MLVVLRYSVNRYVPGGLMLQVFTLENYAHFFRDHYFQKVLLTTVWVSVVCTFVSLVLAFPLAYFLARTRSAAKSMLVMLVVFPLLVGNVVRAAGWMALFGTKGVVNSVLEALHIITVPLNIMYTTGAVIVGIISIVTPFMVLTLQSVLEGINFSVEEAALNLGAAPLRVFTKVTLPLAMPGVIAGTSLVFILCMNAYATPVLLGGPSFQMMAQTIYDQISNTQNWPFGAALAFVLMFVTVALTVIAQVFLHRSYKSAG